jgi:hypothetical protein
MLRRTILVISALAAAALAYKTRPIKPPQGSGAWEPVELDPTSKLP